MATRILQPRGVSYKFLKFVTFFCNFSRLLGCHSHPYRIQKFWHKQWLINTVPENLCWRVPRSPYPHENVSVSPYPHSSYTEKLLERVCQMRFVFSVFFRSDIKWYCLKKSVFFRFYIVFLSGNMLSTYLFGFIIP